ncbi:MAG: hypothetical protein ACI9JN_000938 [Bacteroidia bacterium]|jgi:hypothetical protein
MENIWQMDPQYVHALHEEVYDIKEGMTSNTATAVEPNIHIHLHEALMPNTKLFLSKVMQAAGVTDKDYNTIVHTELSFESIQSEIDNQSIDLIFGQVTNPSIDMYKPMTHSDVASSCLFDSLQAIMEDNVKKRQLWECLKDLFRVSQN